MVDHLSLVLTLRISRVVVVLIVVATAIPAQFGPPSINLWRWNVSDVLANVFLYVPLGLFLRGDATALHVVMVAASLSGVIEIAQLFYVNRISHPLDVGANVLGALAGYVLARQLRVRPNGVRLSRPFGAAMLVVAALWILSTRTFLMYVGGFGWFANELSQPRFWALLPDEIVRLGVEIHQLGVPTNTAIAGVLAAAGVIGLIQPRNQLLRAGAAAAAGFFVGTVIMPHLNIFPLTYTLIGVSAGLALSACCEPAASAVLNGRSYAWVEEKSGD